MRVLPRRGLLGGALALSRETGPPLSEGGMRAACAPGAGRARARLTAAASLLAGALAACGDGVARGPDPLTVRANSGGSVEVAPASGAPVTVAAGGSAPVVAGEALTLTARPAAFHRFAGWALFSHGSVPCRSGEGANPCVLAAGSSSPGDSVAAVFELRAFSVSWRGPGSVAADVDRAALVAAPYAPGAFAGWNGAPCDGSAALECDLSATSGDDPLPTAAFRPFVADVGSVVFGLGYQAAAQAEPPLGFQVLFDDGTGFAPALEGIAPAGDSARLAVPDTLAHPWGAGRYRTEACDGRGTCAPLPDGEAALERIESAAAAAYFKAPVAGTGGFFGDSFGADLALSADGSTLVVGAFGEDSAATGAFAPGDPGYPAALESDGAESSGAVYVYRRSEAGRWALEAFVKAPVAGGADVGVFPGASGSDLFGGSLALSADGSALAVGAPGEDSAATGAFAPTDPGYPAALGSDRADSSGAAYVYRRPPGGRWALEAFVKAPLAGGSVGEFGGDRFGIDVALSADGSALAVGALTEDGPAAGAFAPDDSGYQTALYSGGPWDSRVWNSGAAYVYQRSDAGRWAIETFIKAPVPGTDDFFGASIALSADGSALAVGASGEDSSATGTFAPADDGYQAALDSDGAERSGAAYVYRRSPGGRWALEAFVKAPVSGAGVGVVTGDRFGSPLALSANGSVLAVGALADDSSYTGAFAPGDAGYRAALDSDGAEDSGGAYVHRRSGAGRWALEAFVKAPVSGTGVGAYAGDGFGYSIALSADGGALAVGAIREDSAAAGAFGPTDNGWQAALDSDGSESSGAVYVYRHSGGAWALSDFVKAPVAGDEAYFGRDVALSADGAALAVGSPGEAGGGWPQPRSGRFDGSEDVAEDSGAAYLY